MKTKILSMNRAIQLFTIGAALLIATAAVAQEQHTATESSLSPKFGIKGGINLSNLYVDDVKDENVKVGLNAGFFAKLPLTRGFSIQPELLYSNKGAKETYDNILGKGEYRFNLDYIELPVLAVINVGKNFNLHGGGYISYLAAVNIKDLDSDGTITNVKDLSAENFHRIDYGLVGGLGVDIQKFTIGARYNYGLREVGKSGSLSGDLTKNSKNSAINVYLGFAF
jgi:hypothetical protein